MWLKCRLVSLTFTFYVHFIIQATNFPTVAWDTLLGLGSIKICKSMYAFDYWNKYQIVNWYQSGNYMSIQDKCFAYSLVNYQISNIKLSCQLIPICELCVNSRQMFCIQSCTSNYSRIWNTRISGYIKYYIYWYPNSKKKTQNFCQILIMLINVGIEVFKIFRSLYFRCNIILRHRYILFKRGGRSSSMWKKMETLLCKRTIFAV